MKHKVVLKKFKNRAFTLSEVLITLTIIGVIAAITVPVVQANYRRQAASGKILKFYSTMNQVVIKAKAAGNDWEDWADTATTSGDSTSATTKSFVETYLLPYIVYYKYETSGSQTWVYLNDGTYFYTYKGGCLDFIFDTNGSKKPNKEGRDRFRFLYCPYSNTAWIASGKIIPYQKATMTTREQAMTYCKSVSGMYCTALLNFDGWQFKDDYPLSI